MMLSRSFLVPCVPLPVQALHHCMYVCISCGRPTTASPPLSPSFGVLFGTPKPVGNVALLDIHAIEEAKPLVHNTVRSLPVSLHFVLMPAINSRPPSPHFLCVHHVTYAHKLTTTRPPHPAPPLSLVRPLLPPSHGVTHAGVVTIVLRPSRRRESPSWTTWAARTASGGGRRARRGCGSPCRRERGACSRSTRSR